MAGVKQRHVQTEKSKLITSVAPNFITETPVADFALTAAVQVRLAVQIHRAVELESCDNWSRQEQYCYSSASRTTKPEITYVELQADQ